MFLEASISHSVHRGTSGQGEGLPPGASTYSLGLLLGCLTPGRVCLRSGVSASKGVAATAAVGTNPTGMHSYSNILLFQIRKSHIQIYFNIRKSHVNNPLFGSIDVMDLTRHKKVSFKSCSHVKKFSPIS